MQRTLLAPLAVRFARTGVTLTFSPEFVAWVAARHPGNGDAGLTWLDRVLVPALVASMPPGATSLAAEIHDDRPVLVEPAAAADRAGSGPGYSAASCPPSSASLFSLRRTRSRYAWDFVTSADSASTVFAMLSSARTLKVSISSIVA